MTIIVPERTFYRCRSCDVHWVPLGDVTESLPFNLTDYTSKQQFKGWSFEASVKNYMKLFRELPYSPGERLLEIGPGNGEALEAAKRLGLQCTGFDVDAEAIARLGHISGVRLVHGKLDRDSFPDADFDVIFSNNVIEHIPRPIEFLRSVRSLLAPNGRVWVSCPNVASYQSRILRSYWPQYAPVDHVRLYSPRTLRYAFERAGLKVDRIWTSEGSFDFPLTMLAGARNVLIRRSTGNSPLSAREYGGGATVPTAPPLQQLMKFAYRAVPILGVPFALISPRLGVAQHLRGLARNVGPG